MLYCSTLWLPVTQFRSEQSWNYSQALCAMCVRYIFGCNFIRFHSAPINLATTEIQRNSDRKIQQYRSFSIGKKWETRGKRKKTRTIWILGFWHCIFFVCFVAYSRYSSWSWICTTQNLSLVVIRSGIDYRNLIMKETSTVCNSRVLAVRYGVLAVRG